MYRFSYKVNQRRRIRQLKRQSIKQIIVSNNESCDNDYNGESNEELLQTQHQQQQPYEETSYMSINNQNDLFPSNIYHLDDDINWISEDEVKSKQCTPAEQDGFVLVESGSRKYTGFVFETGDFDVCNKAADVLSQKQHEDIESDYELGKENNSPSVISLNVSDVPLLISTNRNTNESNLHSPQHVVYNSIGMNHAVTPIRRNTRGDKSQIKKMLANDSNEFHSINNRNTNTTNAAATATSTTTTSSICYIDPPVLSSSPSRNNNDSVVVSGTSLSKSLLNAEIFKENKDEPGIDLIKIPGTKGKANLYVTQLIQIMYTMEQLVALQPADTYNDYKYKLIQDAVRIKFKISDEQFDQLFSEWLREVFLAKRRVTVAKLKPIKDSD
ncbi:unnamed protein product [Rotaria magnacalcarata]|uniref:Uncharacterized protein n=4 Tax=Rotaria magnacalcarata TaxID=392030 RepID=A0A8S2SQ86_9BILA|nr:unnamed protein product [Rotaria magnacalcarata]